MNLCRPDSFKSCAACCGLYNVPDGRCDVLKASILERTKTFMDVPRTVGALICYGDYVRDKFDLSPLDPEIHVCEYTGFVDEIYLNIGCMLHPDAPGNNGVDLRGLCYYGSVACKTFYCPASEDLSGNPFHTVKNLIKDWHLYGLVATDINYVSALLGLIELSLDKKLDTDIVLRPGPSEMLLKLLAWKGAWPYGMGSKKRRSAYYLKCEPVGQDEGQLINSIIDSLCFTFDISRTPHESILFVRREIQAFLKVYQQAESLGY